MQHCNSCNRGCGGCGGCANQLELTEGEVKMLRSLGQIPFQPVARKADDMTPIYLEQVDETPQTYSLILQCLEKKGLITIDYDQPLRGFSMDAYQGYPVYGSMALTARGQAVLELLDLQGLSD